MIDRSSTTIFTLTSTAAMLADARPAALLATASLAAVLADARPAALLALASNAAVLANSRPAALLARVSPAAVLALATAGLAFFALLSCRSRCGPRRHDHRAFQVVDEWYRHRRRHWRRDGLGQQKIGNHGPRLVRLEMRRGLPPVSPSNVNRPGARTDTVLQKHIVRIF